MRKSDLLSEPTDVSSDGVSQDTALVWGIFNSGAGFIKICIGNVLRVKNTKDKRNTSFLFILSLVCSQKLLLT